MTLISRAQICSFILVFGPFLIKGFLKNARLIVFNLIFICTVARKVKKIFKFFSPRAYRVMKFFSKKFHFTRWRWRESNSRPKLFIQNNLQAYLIYCFRSKIEIRKITLIYSYVHPPPLITRRYFVIIIDSYFIISNKWWGVNFTHIAKEMQYALF